MRFKKGFTLAEILIVLMVIGALATMTVPALMKGVTETQTKTAYKKAFNTIANLIALERTQGNSPTVMGAGSINQLLDSMINNMSVNGYAEYNACDGVACSPSAIKPNIQYKLGTETKETGSTDAVNATSITNSNGSPWIVGDDGIAYRILTSKASGTCENKSVINEQKTLANAQAKACVYVLVDVNGLGKMPNRLDSQVETFFTNAQDKMKTLDGDRFYIYVGKDGATAGSKMYSATGRIVSDMS